MKTAFIIYIKSVGLYALITFPALMLPIMYLISLFYVLVYGWFAFALFSIIYLLVVRRSVRYEVQMAVLFLAVLVSVLFAFQMLQVLQVEENIWDAETFLLFPAAAVAAGWIALFNSREKIRTRLTETVFEFSKENKVNEVSGNEVSL